MQITLHGTLRFPNGRKHVHTPYRKGLRAAEKVAKATRVERVVEKAKIHKVEVEKVGIQPGDDHQIGEETRVKENLRNEIKVGPPHDPEVAKSQGNPPYPIVGRVVTMVWTRTITLSSVTIGRASQSIGKNGVLVSNENRI